MDAETQILIESGRANEALVRAKKRLDESKTTGDEAAYASALLAEAAAEQAQGRSDDAVTTIDEAISHARRTFGPTDRRYADALELGAEIAAGAGMPASATARFASAVEILEAAGVDDYPLAHAMYEAALFRRSQGDIEGASRALLGAFERSKESTDPSARRVCAMALTVLGRLSLEGGLEEEARELGMRALGLWVELGEARLPEVADAMALVGTAALEGGDPRTGTEFLEPACEVYARSKVDVRDRHSAAAANLGRSFEALAATEKAHAAYTRAIDLLREGDPRRLALEQRLLDLARS